MSEATMERSGLSRISESEIDPITYEVLANAFTAVVDDMGAMLEKVSFSTAVSIGKDYVCALTLPDGSVFARGVGGLPMMTGTAAHRARAVLRFIPVEEMEEGDVFLVNDPFLGGTHAQDVTTVMPVFVDGEVACFVISAAHWPDVGGPVAGSFNSEATSTHAEALLMTPIRIVRAGVDDLEVERFILRNVRIPTVLRGDLRGMIEACNTGRDRFTQLVEKYGIELLRLQADTQLKTSEQRLREEIGNLPDGTYSFTDYIDRDPVGDSAEPIPVHLDMVVEGERMVMDLSKSGASAAGPVNCTASAAQAAVMAGVHAIFHEIPWNEGLEGAVELVLGPGTVVNAEFPRPVSGMAASPGEKVLACVHGCMVQVRPERSMACPTNLVNVNIFGHDEREGHEGEEYVMYLWLAGGWGGRPGRRDAHTSLFPMGPSTNLQPIEFLESVYPVRFHAFQLKDDSEGAGRHRGGFALECPWEMTHGGAVINVQGDRQVLHGWGVEGGEPHGGTDIIYARGTDDEQRFGVMSANNEIEPRVRIDYWQSGGGGWQDPKSRPPEWVLEDVQSGLVSAERAREVYGVVVTAADDPTDVEVDAEATAELRR